MEEKDPQVDALFLLKEICGVSGEKLMAAFDVIDLYITHYKKQKGKKKPLITKEPKQPLKLVQQRLLHFLYKLKYRTDAYRYHSSRESLAHKPVLEHLLDTKMRGQIPGRSMQSAVRYHLDSNALFLIKMDLKDAYPSVKVDVLEKALFQIFLDECKAYYFAYQKTLEAREVKRQLRDFISNKNDFIQYIAEKIEDTVVFPTRFSYRWEKEILWKQEAKKILLELGFEKMLERYSATSWLELPLVLISSGSNTKRKESSTHNYPSAPLFPAYLFPKFRKKIRDLVLEGKDIEQSEIVEIIKYFTEYFVQLTMFEGSLPKGAPTSGMLLNIVVSESKMLEGITWRNETCTMYVDDILITTDKKPDKDRIEALKTKIEESGIFKHNPKKIRVYDLRNKSGSVLGMKLVRRPISENEDVTLRYDSHLGKPRGYRRALKQGRVWTVLAVTLSKKKQNQYRAFLHRVTTKEFTDEEKSRALGYHGVIVSVYGWPVFLMPSSLAKTVQAFRKKFDLTGIRDKNKYKKSKRSRK